MFCVFPSSLTLEKGYTFDIFEMIICYNRMCEYKTFLHLLIWEPLIITNPTKARIILFLYDHETQNETKGFLHMKFILLPDNLLAPYQISFSY